MFLVWFISWLIHLSVSRIIKKSLGEFSEIFGVGTTD